MGQVQAGQDSTTSNATPDASSAPSTAETPAMRAEESSATHRDSACSSTTNPTPDASSAPTAATPAMHKEESSATNHRSACSATARGHAASRQEEAESLYSMQHVEEKAQQAVNNISTLTSFKSTILARTAVYDSPGGIRQSLSFFKRRFKWFDFDESNLERTTTYYCCDEQGMHNVHLTGYLIMCHKVDDGTYVFRACVAEFYEQVTFDQLAYKVLASSTSIGGGIAAAAGVGAAAAWPTDFFTYGTGSIVGGILGGVGGIIAAIFVNIDADSKEKKIEKKLGSALYDASTNTINSHGIMEALLLHYLLADQRYNIERGEVRITGATEHESATPTARTDEEL